MFHLHVCATYVVNPPKAKGQTFTSTNVLPVIKGKLTGGKSRSKTQCGDWCKGGSEAFDNGRSTGFETTDGRATTNRTTDWKIESLLSTSNRWIGSGETICWIGSSGGNDANANSAETSLGKVD